MQFMLAKDGWTVSFLEEDCKTSLPRHFIFQSELKILDLARHGGAELNLAGRQAIEHGISMGRGSVWLKLTREQYAKLRGAVSTYETLLSEVDDGCRGKPFAGLEIGIRLPDLWERLAICVESRISPVSAVDQ